MAQKGDLVTSAYNSSGVTTQEVDTTDFVWPPSPAVRVVESPRGLRETEITDVNAAPSQLKVALPDSQAFGDASVEDDLLAEDDPLADATTGVEPIEGEETAPLKVNPTEHYPLEPLTVARRRDASLPSAALMRTWRSVQIGPAWVAALGLLALVQGAFILITQFTARESTSPQPVRALLAQAGPEEKTIAPAPVAPSSSPSPSAIGSTAETKPVSGRLLVRSDPAGAKVVVDGRPQGVTPVNLAGVAPGSRRVVVSFANREVEQMVRVEAGSTASVIVPLASATESNAYGRVAVTAPFEVDIFEGQALVGTSRMSELTLSPGSHTLRFVNEAFGIEDTRSIVVEAGQRVSVPVRVPYGELNVNALPWADVSLDGARIGETPLGNVKLTVGQHVVTFRHPELGEKSVSVVVKAGVPARVTADMRK